MQTGMGWAGWADLTVIFIFIKDVRYSPRPMRPQ